jgi:mono/diheme cytochrome c family protein
VLEALARAVAALPPERELWIVVHGRAGDPAASLEVTREQAEGLAEVLGAQLPGRRLRPVGVGMAVPAVLERAERVVEIVVPEGS